MRKRFILMAVLSFSTPVFLYAAEARFEETKTFPLRPGSKLTIRAIDGSITVRSWSRPEAKIHYTKTAWDRSRRRAKERLDELEVRFRMPNDELEISVDDWRSGSEISFWDLFNPETWTNRTGSQVDFEITVPKSVTVDISAEDSDVDVRRVEGDVDIRLDDGDIALRDLRSREVRLETDAGDVEVYKITAPKGYLQIMTDEGDVRIEKGKVDQIDVETDEGDVNLTRLEAEVVSVRTDEGQVELDVTPMRRARYRVVTEEGDVVLLLPKRGDYALDLETDTGRIRSEFEVDVEETESGERVSAKLGRGKHRIRVYTDDGDIFLERK